MKKTIERDLAEILTISSTGWTYKIKKFSDIERKIQSTIRKLKEK